MTNNLTPDQIKEKYWLDYINRRKAKNDASTKKSMETGINTNPSRTTVHYLVGASASGKSRYCQNERSDIVRLSSDEIRKELFGTLAHQRNHELVFSILHKALGDNLNDFDAIYDATNLNRKKRKYFYADLLKQITYSSKEKPLVNIVVFIEPYEVLLKNNNLKPAGEKVPEDVITRMYRTLHVPRIGVDCDSYEVKGETPFFNTPMTYEKLISLNTVEELYELMSEPYKNEMKALFGPHDTPYHLEDINEHINMCIENSGNDKTLKAIALFHDLGKAFVKDGGKYIDHQYVSAMYAMKAFSEIPNMQNGELIIEAIVQHMNAHNGLSDKVIRNNNLNQTLLTYIEAFAEIDSKSRIIE